MQQTSACDDCVVGVLLGDSSSIEFADAEVVALDHLAEVGLVAPIRLISRSPDVDAAAG
jgi:hypothetical protein